MKPPAPLISVVIPAYNAETYVGEAIESVLAQNHRPLDVIVVNDGSTDGTEEVIRRYTRQGVRCLTQPNAGQAAALNRGLVEARGDYFAFLDADDLWVVDKLSRQMALFAQDPALEAVFGHAECFASPESAERIQQRRVIPAGSAPWYSKCTMLIQRAAFHRVGSFQEETRMGDFVDWFFRAREVNLRETMLEDVVMRRRIHESNMGSMDKSLRGQYVRVIKGALDRRRAQVRAQGVESSDAK